MSVAPRSIDDAAGRALMAAADARAPVAAGADARRFIIGVHESLAAAEPLWRAFERDGACTAFQLHDWAARVVRHLGAGAQPLIVDVRDAGSGKPLLLAPLLLRQRFGYSSLEWLSCGVCDYSAPLLAKEAALSASEARRIWAAMLPFLPKTDLIDIDGIPREVAGMANPLALVEPVAESVQTALGLALEGDPDTLLDRVCPPAFMRELRLKQRRLEKYGELRFVAPGTAEAAEALFEVLLQQRRERFLKLGRFDLLNDPAATAFYRDAVRHGAEGGPMKICGLRVGDDWLGVATVMVHAGTTHGCLLSIGDERWRNTSPGLQLIAQIMRWSCAQGHAYFDFSVGAEGYKTAIGARSQPLFRIRQARTAKGAVIIWSRRRAEAAMAWLRTYEMGYEALRKARRRLRSLIGL